MSVEDQEIRARLTAILKDREDWHPDDLAHAVDAIVDDIELLNDICEYVARRINAEADAVAKMNRTSRQWDSVYDIPFGVKFWPLSGVDGRVLLPSVAWERLTHDTCRIPGTLFVEGSRDLDAKYPNGFSEVPETSKEGK